MQRVEHSDDEAQRRPWLRPVLIAAAVVGMGALLFAVWDHEAHIEWLRDASPFRFFTVMALSPLLGMPLLPLLVLAGASFGVQIGIVGSLLALAVNLTATWGIARLLRPALSRLIQRLGYRLPQANAAQSPVRLTLAVKMAPGVPAFLKHYGLALAGVPFTPYFLLSMLITGAFCIATVVLGGSLFEHRLTPAQLVLGLTMIVALVWVWRRRKTPSLEVRHE